MSWLGNGLALLRDERIAPLAVSTLPAWLWSADATRILWANPTGAAIFGAATSSSVSARKFDAGQPAAAQIAQLASTLPAHGAPQPVRLRGFGAGIGRALTCRCSRVALPDGSEAILVVATERAGPELSLGERATRLLAGCDQPVAVFSTGGALLHATPAATALLRGAPSLAALGIEALARDALRAGEAAGRTTRHAVRIDRIGGDQDAVLLAAFAELDESEMPAVEAPVIAAPPPVAVEPAMSEPSAPAALQSKPPVAMDSDATQPVESPAPAIADTVVITTPDPHDAAPADIAAETVAPAEPEPVVTPEPLAAAIAETAAPEPAVAAPAQPAPKAVAEPPLPVVERRHPLRFVWQIDADGRFTLGSDDFIALVGPATAAGLGRTWPEIAAELGLDPEGRVAQALATRDTWSGLTVAWPIDGDADRLTVELSGLPSFDRERQFRGYRGFGVCRDVARLNILARMRSTAAEATAEAAVDSAPKEMPPAATESPPAEPAVPTLSTSSITHSTNCRDG